MIVAPICFNTLDTIRSSRLACAIRLTRRAWLPRLHWQMEDQGIDRFEYDHICVAGNLSGPLATELAYAYPGVAEACSDPYCTGEDPPGNVTTLYQGSWHRGWVVNLTVAAPP